jgi:hypothetical protein
MGREGRRGGGEERERVDLVGKNSFEMNHNVRWLQDRVESSSSHAHKCCITNLIAEKEK